jgi:hypothetical protein
MKGWKNEDIYGWKKYSKLYSRIYSTCSNNFVMFIATHG